MLRTKGPPPKRIPGFHITKIAHTIQLSSFDLNDPETLAPFADEDADADFETDFETDTITSLDDEEIESDANVFEEETDDLGKIFGITRKHAKIENFVIKKNF